MKWVSTPNQHSIIALTEFHHWAAVSSNKPTQLDKVLKYVFAPLFWPPGNAFSTSTHSTKAPLHSGGNVRPDYKIVPAGAEKSLAARICMYVRDPHLKEWKECTFRAKCISQTSEYEREEREASSFARAPAPRVLCSARCSALPFIIIIIRRLPACSPGHPPLSSNREVCDHQEFRARYPHVPFLVLSTACSLPAGRFTLCGTSTSETERKAPPPPTTPQYDDTNRGCVCERKLNFIKSPVTNPKWNADRDRKMNQMCKYIYLKFGTLCWFGVNIYMNVSFLFE